MKRIALMTGGGDCAGINAFIASAASRARECYGLDVIGIRNAFKGACADRPEDYAVSLGASELVGLSCQPSTILGSSRFAPFSNANRALGFPNKLMANLERLGVEGLILTGGDDTLGSALELDAMGIPVVGAPKGIDNDVSGTDVMLGYATAVNFGGRAIMSTTASARTHRRISVVEVMGRNAGWLSLHTGIAGGADVILIPERPLDLKRVVARIGEVFERQGYCSVVVAEGTCIPETCPIMASVAARCRVVEALISEDVSCDEHGNPKFGGVGEIMRRVIAVELGLEPLSSVRTTDLGFILRGLDPIAEDIILGTRFGIAAVDMLANGVHGKMVGLRGTRVEAVGLAEALVQKNVDWTDEELRSVGVYW